MRLSVLDDCQGMAEWSPVRVRGIVGPDVGRDDLLRTLDRYVPLLAR